MSYPGDWDGAPPHRRPIYAAIEAERERQAVLFPAEEPLGLFMAILTEEVGEVARELLPNGEGLRHAGETHDLQEELTHVAAVCVKWIERLRGISEP